MTPLGQISAATLDTLQALSERSLRRATETVSALLGHPVRLEVSGVRALTVRSLPSLAEGPDTGPTAGLRFQIAGEGGGEILLLFPLATVFRMLRVLLGASEEPRLLSDQERSALEEVGNILVSSFLSGLGDQLGKRLRPTPPQFHLDSVPRLLQPLLAGLAPQGAEVLVVQALFQDPEQQIEGRFFVLPELASLEALVGSAPHPAPMDGGDEARGGQA